MHSNDYYRAQGRQMLGGSLFHKNWMMSLLACAIVSAISGLFSVNVDVSNGTVSYEQMVFAFGTMGLSSVVGVFVLGPLTIGLSGVFLRSYRTGEVKLEELFAPFKSYASNLLLSFMHTLLVCLWTLLFIIPGIVKSYSYALAFYIKQDNPERDWKYCIDESIRLMDGYKGQLFLLELSFFGWILVSIFTCGIGMLWVSPYMNAARTSFYVERKYIDDVARGVIALDVHEESLDDAGTAEQNG